MTTPYPNQATPYPSQATPTPNTPTPNIRAHPAHHGLNIIQVTFATENASQVNASLRQLTTTDINSMSQLDTLDRGLGPVNQYSFTMGDTLATQLGSQPGFYLFSSRIHRMHPIHQYTFSGITIKTGAVNDVSLSVHGKDLVLTIAENGRVCFEKQFGWSTHPAVMSGHTYHEYPGFTVTEEDHYVLRGVMDTDYKTNRNHIFDSFIIRIEAIEATQTTPSGMSHWKVMHMKVHEGDAHDAGQPRFTPIGEYLDIAGAPSRPCSNVPSLTAPVAMRAASGGIVMDAGVIAVIAIVSCFCLAAIVFMSTTSIRHPIVPRTFEPLPPLRRQRRNR